MPYTYKIEYKGKPVSVSFNEPPNNVQDILKAMRTELASLGTDEHFQYFNLTMKWAVDHQEVSEATLSDDLENQEGSYYARWIDAAGDAPLLKLEGCGWAKSCLNSTNRLQLASGIKSKISSLGMLLNLFCRSCLPALCFGCSSKPASTKTMPVSHQREKRYVQQSEMRSLLSLGT